MTQDQHMIAIEWLEEHLADKLFIFDCGDVTAMVEQVTVEP